MKERTSKRKVAVIVTLTALALACVGVFTWFVWTTSPAYVAKATIVEVLEKAVAKLPEDTKSFYVDPQRLEEDPSLHIEELGYQIINRKDGEQVLEYIRNSRFVSLGSRPSVEADNTQWPVIYVAGFRLLFQMVQEYYVVEMQLTPEDEAGLRALLEKIRTENTRLTPDFEGQVWP
ncbi:MAG: hypothetical protein IKD06_03875 [Clostridia bacterium]|nr:hypothetical protein [Clostridia bacterium]